LLDDLTAKVRVDQASHGAINSIHKAVVANAVLASKLRKRLGFENTHCLS
jgi:hypothetical protein